jgi:hypothetical protein
MSSLSIQGRCWKVHSRALRKVSRMTSADLSPVRPDHRQSTATNFDHTLDPMQLHPPLLPCQHNPPRLARPLRYGRLVLRR